MRGYYKSEQVACGISLPSERYDMGFVKNGDTYTPYFESGFQPQGVAAERGAEDINGGTCQVYNGAGQVGLLSQRYRLIQLENNARRNNMSTRRIQKEKGQVSLEVTHR